MNELALDPTETRRPRAAAETPSSGRPLGRIALVSTLGVAGLGAFAAASALMSDLTGSPAAPVRAPATQQSAADWPDLKDGLPALASAGPTGADAPRRITLPAADAAVAAPAQPPAAPEPAPAPAPKPLASLEPPAPAALPGIAAPPVAAAKPLVAAPPVAAAKPAPTIENAPVIAPARQAGVLPPPNRTAPTVAARPAETVRARTASTSFAALPPEPDRAAAGKPAPAKPAEIKPAEIKPAEVRTEAKAEESAKRKPEKAAAARKPAPAPVAATPVAATKIAAAQPAPAPEAEETEVFGIRVPTLAATGRRIGASVEALGDAVKGLPDRF